MVVPSSAAEGRGGHDGEQCFHVCILTCSQTMFIRSGSGSVYLNMLPSTHTLRVVRHVLFTLHTCLQLSTNMHSSTWHHDIDPQEHLGRLSFISSQIVLFCSVCEYNLLFQSLVPICCPKKCRIFTSDAPSTQHWTHYTPCMCILRTNTCEEVGDEDEQKVMIQHSGVDRKGETRMRHSSTEGDVSELRTQSEGDRVNEEGTKRWKRGGGRFNQGQDVYELGRQEGLVRLVRPKDEGSEA